MLEKAFHDFVREVQARNLCTEGVAIADENRVLFEHHFTADIPRNIYSHTKSYMATAAGLAIAEGKLSLDDKLVDLFPEYVPDRHDPRLERVTLRSLLTMSSGMNRPYLMGVDRRAGVGLPDYMAYFMSLPMETEPGSRFVYSSADSIIAGRMVEKAVGKRLGEYLYDKLFSRLGQGWPIWECDGQGHPTGCGGLELKLTEMMKLGQLYLANGRWQGEQIVDPDWVRMASAKQIDTEPSEDSWVCGYGFQFWCSPFPSAYRADGAYGQITTVLPESGLVVAIQNHERGDFADVKPLLNELITRACE